MKYYLHDSNSFNDAKITELYIKFGYEGLGLFYTILEKLAQQEKPIKTEVLKAQLNVGKKLNKCWNFMESLSIISSNNGDTFNKQLLNYAEKYLIKKERNRKKIAEWRANNENVTSNETDVLLVRNAPKVNRSKVKESKVNVVTPDISLNERLFNDIYSRYPDKTGKKAAYRHFNATVKNDIDLVRMHRALDNYLKSERVKKGYTQNASTWFNNWQDWEKPTPTMMGNLSTSSAVKGDTGKYGEIECPENTQQQ